MPTLLDYRRRIRSVRNTQKITRAMKFVAAAQLRRAQARVFAARPYAAGILRVLRSAVARVEEPLHPLLAVRPENRLLVLVVSSDKGLCGAFNANIVRRAAEFLEAHRRQSPEIMPVGRKSRDAMRKQPFEIAAEFLNVSRRVQFEHAKQIAGRVSELYQSERVDAVYAIYNEFKNVLVQRLTVQKLLPIAPEVLGETAGKPPVAALHRTVQGAVDYLYEQPPREIFARLLPRYLETELYRVLLESAAAEQAARMTAMDAATTNAGEMIDQLTLKMNKVRQATITREIIEVVSGAATL
jgi:F-type H+-transporting ATPase subunit gamma